MSARRPPFGGLLLTEIAEMGVTHVYDCTLSIGVLNDRLPRTKCADLGHKALHANNDTTIFNMYQETYLDLNG